MTAPVGPGERNRVRSRRRGAQVATKGMRVSSRGDAPAPTHGAVSCPDGSIVVQAATDESLSGVVWSGTRFVAVGSKGTIVHSSDGVSWMTAGHSATRNELRGVAWNGTRFVAVGASGTMVHSRDGDTWIAVTDKPSGDDLRDVAWSGAQFVAVGWNGTIVVSP